MVRLFSSLDCLHPPPRFVRGTLKNEWHRPPPLSVQPDSAAAGWLAGIGVTG